MGEGLLALIQGEDPPTPDRQRRRSSAAKPKTPAPPPSPEALRSLYVLEVTLIDGPATEAFLKKNPQIIRTIEIRGDQTLADLHRIIFTAFDREIEIPTHY